MSASASLREFWVSSSSLYSAVIRTALIRFRPNKSRKRRKTSKPMPSAVGELRANSLVTITWPFNEFSAKRSFGSLSRGPQAFGLDGQATIQAPPSNPTGSWPRLATCKHWQAFAVRTHWRINETKKSRLMPKVLVCTSVIIAVTARPSITRPRSFMPRCDFSTPIAGRSFCNDLAGCSSQG